MLDNRSIVYYTKILHAIRLISPKFSNNVGGEIMQIRQQISLAAGYMPRHDYCIMVPWFVKGKDNKRSF